MLDTYVEERLKDFRKSPNDQGLAKAVIHELNVLVERVTRIQNIRRSELERECKFLEIVKCIKNQRLHYHEKAGFPLFDDVNQTGFINDEEELVCETVYGETYSLIDIAEASYNFLKKYVEDYEL